MLLFKIVQLFTKAVDFIKILLINEEKIEASAKRILESAKKVEGFLGGGYTEEKIIAKIKEELIQNKSTLAIYMLLSVLMIPIFLLLSFGIVKSLGVAATMCVLNHIFYTICFTVVSIIYTLKKTN